MKIHLSTILVIQANHLFQSILTLYFLNISSAFTLRYRLLFVLVTEILIYRQHCNQTGSISFRYFPEILILLSPFQLKHQNLSLLLELNLFFHLFIYQKLPELIITDVHTPPPYQLPVLIIIRSNEKVNSNQMRGQKTGIKNFTLRN